MKSSPNRFLSLVVWTIPSVVLFFYLLCAFVPTVFEGSSVPRYSYESYLLDFQRRLEQYQKEPGNCIVIIGPSYGTHLGGWEGVYNLSLTSGRPAELAQIVSLCKESDLVIFPLTVRELSLTSQKPRLSAIAGPPRKLVIVRAAFQKKIGLVEDPPVVNQEQFNERWLYRQLELFQLDESDISLEPFLALQEAHPNIVFVLNPVYPGTKLANPTAALANLFRASPLRCLDYSNALDASAFNSFCHLTTRGNDLLRSKLQGDLSILLQKERI